ncbi:hypothetical protein Scep_007326 [Stephania cephalantha]|uniref:Uncharacterized protein n=1 Tax=Stephania cephalantha TaxID=152367 RepID=A0AAP0PN49_9MAGN
MEPGSVLDSVGFTYLTLSNSYNWIITGYNSDKGKGKLSEFSGGEHWNGEGLDTPVLVATREKDSFLNINDLLKREIEWSVRRFEERLGGERRRPRKWDHRIETEVLAVTRERERESFPNICDMHKQLPSLCFQIHVKTLKSLRIIFSDLRIPVFTSNWETSSSSSPIFPLSQVVFFLFLSGSTRYAAGSKVVANIFLARPARQRLCTYRHKKDDIGWLTTRRYTDITVRTRNRVSKRPETRASVLAVLQLGVKTPNITLVQTTPLLSNFHTSVHPPTYTYTTHIHTHAETRTGRPKGRIRKGEEEENEERAGKEKRRTGRPRGRRRKREEEENEERAGKEKRRWRRHGRVKIMTTFPFILRIVKWSAMLSSWRKNIQNEIFTHSD